MRFEYRNEVNGIILTNYHGEESEVVIPSTIDGKVVVGMDAYTFVEEGLQIEVIEVVGSVKHLLKDTFDSCFSLKKVILQDGVEVVEEGFLGSSAIEELVLPKSIQEIKGIARFPFTTCIDQENPNYVCDGYGIYKKQENGLYLEGILPAIQKESYRVLDGTVEICKQAFFNQEKELKQLILPASLKHIETGALQSTMYSFEPQRGILDYVVKSDVFTFEDGCLVEHGSSNVLLAMTKDVRHFVIPEDIDKVGTYAFLNAKIQTLVCNARLAFIEKDAFYGASFEEIQYADTKETILFPIFHEVLKEDMLKGFGRNGKLYSYKNYDQLLCKKYISSERVRMITNRLLHKRDLSTEYEQRYIEILLSQFEDTIRYILERNDLDSLQRMLDLSLINETNMDQCLRLIGETSNTQAIALVLEYKHTHMHEEAFDFSL